MEFSPEVWWFLFGVALVVTEMFISGFFVAWFGVSALLVSVLALTGIVNSLAIQIFIWAIIGGLAAWIWFRMFKPKTHLSRLGDAGRAAVGTEGIIERNDSGELEAVFTQALLGQRRWPIIATNIQEGDGIRVIEVVSNRLRVEKSS